MVDFFSRYSKLHLFIRKQKDALVHPFVVTLNALNITPNMLGWLRIVLAIVIFFVFENALFTFILLLLIFLSDAFDGALARYQKSISDRGAFIDVLSDNFVMTLVVYAFLVYGTASAQTAGFHLFIYPLAHTLSIVWFNERKKSDWIIRFAPNLGFVKFPVILFFFAYLLFDINYMEEILILANIAFVLLSLYYFVSIQLRWVKGKKRQA